MFSSPFTSHLLEVCTEQLVHGWFSVAAEARLHDLRQVGDHGPRWAVVLKCNLSLRGKLGTDPVLSRPMRWPYRPADAR